MHDCISMKVVRATMQALLERMMPVDYKTLHTVNHWLYASLAGKSALRVSIEKNPSPTPPEHGTRRARAAKYFSMVGELKYLP